MATTTNKGRNPSICIDCGLCCDGTLYTTVPVLADDKRQPLEAAEVTFTKKDDMTSLRQPCMAFRSGCCSIYEDRPTLCKAFRCTLLKRYDAGTSTFAQSRDLIEAAIELRDKVRPALERFVEADAPKSLPELYRLMHDKLADLEGDAQAKRAISPMLVEVAALRLLLNRNFELHSTDDDEAKRPVSEA